MVEYAQNVVHYWLMFMKQQIFPNFVSTFQEEPNFVRT